MDVGTFTYERIWIAAWSRVHLEETPRRYSCWQDVHRAVVLIRGRWEENPTSLVGHSNYTLAASFSPTIYHKAVPITSSAAQAGASGCSSGTSSTSSKGSAGGNRAGGDGTNGASSTSATKGGHQVVAVAGQDRVVTVWLAAANRPVAILREVFDKPPSDLSWGTDGYTLLISGHDGTVVILRFTKAELGMPLPEVTTTWRRFRKGGWRGCDPARLLR